MQKLRACRNRSSPIQRCFDEDATHQRDLSGGAAERQDADLGPDGERFLESRFS
jgi:hypothetical protein